MLTRDEVLAIARMARLSFTPSELDRLQAELHGILEHVASLRQVARPMEDSGAAPHTDAAGDRARLRPDTPGAAPRPDAVEHAAPLRPDAPGADRLAMPPSAIAPEWRDGFFTVPRRADRHA